MLRKLIKYDMRYGVKIIVLIHAVFLFACLSGRILFVRNIDFQADLQSSVFMITMILCIYILLFSAASFGTSALLAVRFYKNLFTNEGYLTWTVPATALQQLWSKIISGAIWYSLDITCVYLGLVLLLTTSNVLQAYKHVAPEFIDIFGMSAFQFGLAMFMLTLFTAVASVITIYTCIVIGQLFPGHRVLCALVVYFIIYIILQAISTAGLFIFHLTPAVRNTSGSTAFFTQFFGILIWVLILSAIFAIIEYLITRHIMTKKLNLC